ncbi:TonB-dependent receptor [Sphingomonas faeni]|uniref:TonB-dependent receptor n=1 Tax=Sphingomonas faeni TaxID=185950 RepID=UPI00335C1E9E
MGRIACQILIASAFTQAMMTAAVAAPADDRPSPVPSRFDIEEQDLSKALNRAAQIGGVNLLFDRARLAGRRSRRLNATTTPRKAFAALLRGSDIKVRQVGEKTFVLIAQAARPDVVVNAPVPEIVVLGRRSNNVDIARLANDIQPYRVVTSHDIENDQPTSSEQLLRDLLPSNDLAATARQAPVAQQGRVQSQVDLRGLGTFQTLILVDGRRLPSAPASQDFLQPDINGLPPEAIERIETLGGTAGGIYGPGATGGVVNIVLKRDFPSPWFKVATGINSRGDGAERRLAGGFSKDLGGGATHISVLGSLTKDQGLNFGDRGFVSRARALQAERGGSLPPYSPALNITSLGGGPLSLNSLLGGTALGSSFTTSPIGSLGTGGTDTRALLAGAGHYDLRLSPDGEGAEQNLLTPFTTSSVIASVRQKVGSHFELFSDYLRTEDVGTAVGPGPATAGFILDPGMAGNPFAQTILVTFPTPGVIGAGRYRSTTSRATIGVIIRLPRSWAAELDGSVGRSTVRQTFPNPSAFQVVDLFSTDEPVAGLATLTANSRIRRDIANKFTDAALRVAGPLMTLSGGPLSLTLTAERRHEHTPRAQADPPDTSEGFLYSSADHRISVTSGAAEARLPLVSEDAPFAALRGLELQLAVRGDLYRIAEPEYVTLDEQNAPAAIAHYSAVTYTVGARVRPTRGVLLRGSLATGILPPSPGLVVPRKSSFDFQPFPDPKRPNAPIDFQSPVTFLDSGSRDLRPERARTLSAGIVLEPKIVPGLRASIDFTRITKSHEITDFAANNYPYFIAHEAQYPDRIGRAALTAQDMALGYTGGVINYIDTSPLNVGRTKENALDADLEYSARLRPGLLRMHAGATWIPALRRRGDPDVPYDQLSGHVDGPMRWKAVASADLQKGRLSGALTGLLYGSSHVTFGQTSYLNGLVNAERIKEQGASTIGSQFYLDASLSYRAQTGSGAEIKLQFGIKNLLGQMPPLVIPTLQTGSFNAGYVVGYSTYGDPSGRRFQFSATTNF